MSSSPTVDYVFKEIVNKIINGIYLPGSKIPTETELVEEFAVGRNTIREAIKKLEAFGILSIKRSEGTFVNDVYNSQILMPMLYGTILGNNCWDSFVDMRGVVDIGVLNKILPLVKGNDLALLRLYLEQFHQYFKTNDIDNILKVDEAFHLALTAVLDNKMIYDIEKFILGITEFSRKKAIISVLDERKEEDFIRKHQDIIDVLEKKDYENINRCIRNHYTFWESAKCSHNTKSKD